MTLIYIPFWTRAAAGQATQEQPSPALCDTINALEDIIISQHRWKLLCPPQGCLRDAGTVFTSILTRFQEETASPDPPRTMKPVHNLHTEINFL